MNQVLPSEKVNDHSVSPKKMSSCLHGWLQSQLLVEIENISHYLIGVVAMVSSGSRTTLNTNVSQYTQRTSKAQCYFFIHEYLKKTYSKNITSVWRDLSFQILSQFNLIKSQKNRYQFRRQKAKYLCFPELILFTSRSTGFDSIAAAPPQLISRFATYFIHSKTLDFSNAFRYLKLGQRDNAFEAACVYIQIIDQKHVRTKCSSILKN